LVISIVLHFIFPVSDSGNIAERISVNFEKFKIIPKPLHNIYTVKSFPKSPKISIAEIRIIVHPLPLIEDKNIEPHLRE